MRIAIQTDIGRIRMLNEDRAVIQNMKGFALAIVADGMGGHQAGDVASQMAIDLIQKHLEQSLSESSSLEECKLCVEEAILKANQEIFEVASGREQFHGMGTTVVAALQTHDTMIIAHVGDSRAYKIDQSSIVQLTEDHTLVNELLKYGQLTPEEADHHPRRNVITRALGTDQEVQVDVQELGWKEKEIVLLCTDGLSGMVDETSIFTLIHSEANLQKAADRLVQAALEAGGDDNVTVILLANDQISDDVETR
ncbi:Stp1/IreP family PP2C-type Ser/Thr phosphatase [Paenibacillus larvae]|uniref:Protein phosphatase PrpC n=4 Tax=Paenibacillus larvae TaxID=1464 RepID=V9W4V6_9BACL|nr:Stp1/IreP family PP2C-type Ser/Thr phosphatase [Paenibacillus larvae]AHD06061.1 protein phosphatase PrpC [Paenibacillus larvae subsp. larvae DSM 25430]AQR76441.1 serine/threonine protein phosphatase [Paenibacillus larvae subsp. larvae]ARF69829.1 serine/threonine protein phosphatase [Paenibacillus larvae subsp. pulvifaciens]MCY7488924.1 Stp1/IreP family PP2C-type Ser/Thr phosphatase [Paenibacillus larvae]MCY9562322.1 Stp1/IreP family PP2C-type Ser/Thr phosphatase [Paenibacillus larvae]